MPNSKFEAVLCGQNRVARNCHSTRIEVVQSPQLLQSIPFDPGAGATELEQVRKKFNANPIAKITK